MKTHNSSTPKWLPSITGGAGGGVSHAFALIRADKLFSTIYIAGTAVAIASAMVIAIVLNMMLIDIAPESNRSRTLYLYSEIGTETARANGERFYSGLSTVSLDSCFRQMKCVEAAAGVLPVEAFKFQATDENLANNLSVSTMPCDNDFFHLYEFNFWEGRPFSEKEFRDGERVCVITDKVAQRLGLPALTEDYSIYINKQLLRVVGIVKAVSAFIDFATADIYVPYSVDGMGFWPDRHNPGANGQYSGNLTVRILLRKGFTRQDFLDEVEPLRLNYNAVCSTAAGEKVEWVLEARSHFFKMLNFFSSEDESLTDQAKNLMIPTILMLICLFLPALNLSGLVSNRMAARRPEMGIRKAFGAKRRTLLREVINENLVLTLCGGLAGWVLSWLFILAVHNHPVFLQMFVSRDQHTYDTSLDFQMFVTPTLFLVVFLCCAVLNLMVALIPAWRSLKNPIVESLNQKR